jgi:membrane fusion protein (multidrug efflux system)
MSNGNEENLLNAQETKQQKAEQNKNNKNYKKTKIILKITLLLLLIGLLAFLYWFYFIRFRSWTDDAYVNGNLIVLMSPQPGIAVTIFADDTDYVEQGQILMQLDTTTFELEFERAKVALALAARQVKQLQEEVEQRKANVVLQKANLIKAQQDYESRANIGNQEAVSREDVSHAQANLEVAQASFNLARHQLESAFAALGNTSLERHPTIENAKVALRQAFVNLNRTRILAPVSGFVAQRTIQLGEWVTTTRALMSIIPLHQLWVDANFKETELVNVRLGQPVSMTTDFYGPNVVFHGKVDGIEAGTGSVFSLLPPQNASGNWIKVVQRLPVRIYLDPNELKNHPLRLGLSVYTTIDTSNVAGKMLSEMPPFNPKFETPVFVVQMQQIEELIQEIVFNNLSLNQTP